MMTQTLLSAATWASPEAQRASSAPQRCPSEDPSPARDVGRFQWHRPARRGGHSCLCAVAKPIIQRVAEATQSVPSKILIANPRLTFHASPIRICKLRISNRKFSTVFRSQPSLFSSLKPPPSTLQNLIETPRLKITISPILSSASNFLIETKVAFSVIPSPKTRIQCGARENPR